jgi:long-chain acyl-CoA synthetase
MTPCESKEDAVVVEPAATASVEQAHQCESLASIDDCLPYANFGMLWAAMAGRQPNSTWMTNCSSIAEDAEPAVLTYGEFAELIERAASVLVNEYGVGAGQTVALMTIGQPMTAAVYFAAWRIGAKVVPIAPQETDERVAAIALHSRAKLLIVHTSTRTDLAPLDGELGEDDATGLQRTLLLDGTSRDGAIAAGWEDFGAALDEVDFSTVASEPPDVSWNSEAIISYQPLATGELLGAVFTQKQLMAVAYGITQWHDLDERAVVMSARSLLHTSEILLALIAPAFAGAQVVLSRRASAAEFWHRTISYDVVLATADGGVLQRLKADDAEFDPESMPSFRYFVCDAQSAAVDAIGDFQDSFGLKVLTGYGWSLAPVPAAYLPTDLEWHEHAAWACGHDTPSAGCPILTSEMDIRDDKGEPVPKGERGEIVIRGPGVMAGFAHDPSATTAAFAHGWLRTGDEGFKRQGEDGRDYYFVTGRL